MVHVFTIPQDHFSLWHSVCRSYSQFWHQPMSSYNVAHSLSLLCLKVKNDHGSKFSNLLCLLQIQYSYYNGAHTWARKLTHLCFISIARGPISGTGSSRGGPSHPSTSLGLSELQVGAEHYFHSGLASTTHHTTGRPSSVREFNH